MDSAPELFNVATATVICTFSELDIRVQVRGLYRLATREAYTAGSTSDWLRERHTPQAPVDFRLATREAYAAGSTSDWYARGIYRRIDFRLAGRERHIPQGRLPIGGP